MRHAAALIVPLLLAPFLLAADAPAPDRPKPPEGGKAEALTAWHKAHAVRAARIEDGELVIEPSPLAVAMIHEMGRSRRAMATDRHAPTAGETRPVRPSDPPGRLHAPLVFARPVRRGYARPMGSRGLWLILAFGLSLTLAASIYRADAGPPLRRLKARAAVLRAKKDRARRAACEIAGRLEGQQRVDALLGVEYLTPEEESELGSLRDEIRERTGEAWEPEIPSSWRPAAPHARTAYPSPPQSQPSPSAPPASR